MRESLEEELHRAGYDLEEEYFYRLNRKLLEDLRLKREGEGEGGGERQARDGQAREGREDWWMQCPHCGSEMQEREVAGLKGDVCSGCGGVFLEPSELGDLSLTQEPHRFKTIMKNFFAAATKPRPSGVGQFPV